MATTLLALLALPLILYIPGLLLTQALLGQAQTADAVARHYERALWSVLLSGWLALLLAEVRVFSLPLLLALLLLICAPLALLAYRRRVPTPPVLGIVAGRVPVRGGLRAALLSRWQEVAYALVLLLGALLVARPFEVVLGGRDAGVYAVTGFAIARTGGIVQHDELLRSVARDAEAGDPYAAQAYSNFFSSKTPERWIATRMRAIGFFANEGEAVDGRVVPQFFHLFAAWIAVLASVLGMHGGLVATGLMATMGLWSVMLLGRALAGPLVGLLAGLLLCLNGVYVWFGRYSTSEATALFLTFAALYCFARWQMLDGRDNATRRQAILYAALTGIAAGQVALTRIDFFLICGPLGAFLVYCAVSRRWTRAHWALLLALGAMLFHAALHVIFIARAYFFDTAYARLQDYAITSYLALPFQHPVLKEIYYGTTRSKLKDPMNLVRELLALGALLLVLLALYRFGQPLRWFEAALRRARSPLLGAAAVGLLLLSAYAYLVRPQILNADVLWNARGGWGDPLARPPEYVRDEVQRGLTGLVQARSDYGVVFAPVVADEQATQALRTENDALLGKYEKITPPANIAAMVNNGKASPPSARAVYGVVVSPLVVDAEATARLRQELGAARGPWRGPFSSHTPNWLRLQGYIGAPIDIPPGSDPRYTIALANMVRVGWYLSPLGVVLAVVGLALWLKGGLNRASWLFFTVALASGLFYIRQSYGTADQTYIYILRRFLPVVYPAACLGAAYALVALARWPLRRQGARSKKQPVTNAKLVLALGLTALLVAFLLGTNQKIYRHTEYGGALGQVESLASRFEPHAIVIFSGGGTGLVEVRDVPDLVLMPLRFAFGVDAISVRSVQPGKYGADLAMQVRRWQSEGRPVYLALSSNGGRFVLPGVALQKVGRWELRLDEFEQLTAQKPHNVARLLLPMTIYRVAAPDAPATVPLAADGPDAFAAQIRGFYRPEGAGYAWTNGDALLRLPYTTSATSATLRLRVAGGARPATLGPATVCASVLPETNPWPGEVKALPDDPPFTSLGCATLGASPTDYTFPIDPSVVPAATSGTVLVRLETRPSWVPAEVDPALRDQRQLGVQFYSANIAQTP